MTNPQKPIVQPTAEDVQRLVEAAEKAESAIKQNHQWHQGHYGRSDSAVETVNTDVLAVLRSALAPWRKP